MITQNSEVYIQSPLHIFLHYTCIWKDLGTGGLYSSLFCAQKLKALIVPFSRDRSQNCDPCDYEPYGDISGIVTHAQAVDICQAAFSPAQPGNEAKVCPTCRRYLRHSCDILILHLLY